jgi:hypothetical protein
LRVAVRDIACSDLIVDMYVDLAIAVKSVLASLALVRVLYMVLHCACQKVCVTHGSGNKSEISVGVVRIRVPND